MRTIKYAGGPFLCWRQPPQMHVSRVRSVIYDHPMENALQKRTRALPSEVIIRDEEVMDSDCSLPYTLLLVGWRSFCCDKSICASNHVERQSANWRVSTVDPYVALRSGDTFVGLDTSLRGENNVTNFCVGVCVTQCFGRGAEFRGGVNQTVSTGQCGAPN